MTKKQIRDKFNKICLERDLYKCVICGETNNLNVHHIMDRHYFTNGGYVRQNGITLCEKSCHLEAELYHKTNAQDWIDGMHPDDFYKLIGSSFQSAIEADELLVDCTKLDKQQC